MIKTVIMAGGTGSRLWPLSRSLHPKQFLPLAQQETMLQATLLRVENWEDESPVVICNEEHRFIVAEQSRQINKNVEILLEPVGRNTAPAVALAALRELDQGKDPLLFVLAADHVIGDQDEFESSVRKATTLANDGELVTFGVVPSKPETGYGYIRRGDENKTGYSVAEFVEKPEYKRAIEYISSGDYFWNSGMFLFKASRYIEELKKYSPEIIDSCRKSLEKSTKDLDFIRVDEAEFWTCPDISIDYAVMEKTDSASMVPLDANWNDVGAWSSLWDISKKDEFDNSLVGDVVVHASSNCHLHSSGRLVAAVGLENIVVVETKDAVLVAEKNAVQDVKKIVEELKSKNRSEHVLHREVSRPWGKYDSVDSGDRYQVKRITVKPGARLSVQMHHHRAEHWIVVSGTARVGRDGDELLLTENESVYLPVGCTHWLENPGKIPLEIIEVQSGSYLGEDDIVRFDDKYGRVK